MVLFFLKCLVSVHENFYCCYYYHNYYYYVIFYDEPHYVSQSNYNLHVAQAIHNCMIFLGLYYVQF